MKLKNIIVRFFIAFFLVAAVCGFGNVLLAYPSCSKDLVIDQTRMMGFFDSFRQSATTKNFHQFNNILDFVYDENAIVTFVDSARKPDEVVQYSLPQYKHTMERIMKMISSIDFTVQNHTFTMDSECKSATITGQYTAIIGMVGHNAEHFLSDFFSQAWSGDPEKQVLVRAEYFYEVYLSCQYGRFHVISAKYERKSVSIDKTI